MKSTRLLARALILAAGSLQACNCGEDPLTRQGPPDPRFKLDAGMVFEDAAAPDAIVFPDASEPPDSGPELRVLAFAGTSPVVLYFGASQDLSFTLHTVSGAVVPGETISFSFAGTGGALAAMSATTDGTGTGVVRFTAGTSAGQGSITATANLAQPVTVVIQVGEDPNADLTLDVLSSTRIPVSSAEAYVYVGAAGTVPSCAQLYAAQTLPAPSFMASFSAVPGSTAFPHQASGSMVTAFATGNGGRTNLTLARGCTEGVRLTGGTNTHVAVTLEQLPSTLEGDYDALLAIDLGAGFPPPYGPTIVLITDLLSDPAGWAVYQVMVAVDDQTGFGLLEWTPPGTTTPVEASFADVRANPGLFPIWQMARDAFDDFLRTQLGQPYIDITTVGADISHLLRGFEVGAGYTLTATGTPDRLQVVESWKAMVFQWQLGCPAGDLGCARHAFELTGANANLAPADATYGASVTLASSAGESERFHLALDPHEIRVRYGAIILLVLDTLVFPNLPGGIASNSIGGVLANIVDCSGLATSLETATGFPAFFFEGICDSAISAAASSLEAQLLALDSVNNPGLIAGGGPNGGGELVLVDHDQDLQTELVESVLSWATWSTGQAVSSPITGAGRLRATHCGATADCTGGFVCTAVPSYLRVRALENDCRRPLGAGAGNAGCVQDADCASGLCFDPGSASRICFEACTGASACSAGSCVSDVAPIDLNAVLSGLGNATAAACVP